MTTYISECEACGYEAKGPNRNSADLQVAKHRQIGCDPMVVWTAAEDRIANLRWHLKTAIASTKAAIESLAIVSPEPDNDLTFQNLKDLVKQIDGLDDNARRIENDFTKKTFDGEYRR